MDVIVGTMKVGEVYDILMELKEKIEEDKEGVRNMLKAQPVLCHALTQMQVKVWDWNLGFLHFYFSIFLRNGFTHHLAYLTQQQLAMLQTPLSYDTPFSNLQKAHNNAPKKAYPHVKQMEAYGRQKPKAAVTPQIE